jgi:hypothetical protein
MCLKKQKKKPVLLAMDCGQMMRNLSQSFIAAKIVVS